MKEMKKLILVAVALACMIAADYAFASTKRSNMVQPLAKDNKTVLEWNDLFNGTSGSTVAFTVGQTTALGVLPDTTDYRLEYWSFLCRGGTATITGLGSFSLELIEDIGVGNRFSVPTASSITFTVSELTSGATVHYIISGRE